MSKELDLDYQYEQYLKLVGLNESTMHPVQKTETKRAFFGACGQMLILFRDVLGVEEDEDKAVLYMEDLLVQAEMFWTEELKNM